MQTIKRSISTRRKISVILGNAGNYFGWTLLSIFMIPAWMYGAHADLSFLQFNGETVQTEGRLIKNYRSDVVGVEDIYLNEHSVWVNIYEFEDQNGIRHERKGFTDDYARVTTDNTISITYPVNKPKQARAEGLRSAEFSEGALINWLFPLSAFAFIFWSLRIGFREYHLLKTGSLVTAKLIDKEFKHSNRKGDSRYQMTFEYHVDGVTHQISTNKFENEVAEYEKTQPLLYFPKEPQNAIFLHDISRKPEIDEQNQVNPLNTLPIAPILWPVICMAPHIWYYFETFT